VVDVVEDPHRDAAGPGLLERAGDRPCLVSVEPDVVEGEVEAAAGGVEE
jgi:hypothetical protein